MPQPTQPAQPDKLNIKNTLKFWGVPDSQLGWDANAGKVTVGGQPMLWGGSYENRNGEGYASEDDIRNWYAKAMGLQQLRPALAAAGVGDKDIGFDFGSNRATLYGRTINLGDSQANLGGHIFAKPEAINAILGPQLTPETRQGLNAVKNAANPDTIINDPTYKAYLAQAQKQLQESNNALGRQLGAQGIFGPGSGPAMHRYQQNVDKSNEYLMTQAMPAAMNAAMARNTNALNAIISTESHGNDMENHALGVEDAKLGIEGKKIGNEASQLALDVAKNPDYGTAAMASVGKEQAQKNLGLTDAQISNYYAQANQAQGLTPYQQWQIEWQLFQDEREQTQKDRTDYQARYKGVDPYAFDAWLQLRTQLNKIAAQNGGKIDKAKADKLLQDTVLSQTGYGMGSTAGDWIAGMYKDYFGDPSASKYLNQARFTGLKSGSANPLLDAMGVIATGGNGN